MSDGEVALVTGESAGIGLSVARRLVARGFRVALVARTRARLDEAVVALGGEKYAAAFPLDVSRLDELTALPTRVIERFGRLDVLVNNAGVNHRGAMVTRSAAELAEVIATNLTAPMLLTRAAAPLMGDGGAIVNIASLAGRVPVIHEAAYSASKAGLRAFTRVIRDELAPRLKVSLVSPGPVDTGFIADTDDVPDLVFSQPMSSPDKVAAAVVRCIQTGEEEIALPRVSGLLTNVGYLSSGLRHALLPMLERRGARNKRAYLARKGR